MSHASDPVRFVPTLTEIVEVELKDSISVLELPLLTDALDQGEQVSVSAVMDDQSPSQEVVQMHAAAAMREVSESSQRAPSSDAMSAHAWSDELAEQMVHRVVQRLDVLLTQRVGDAIAAVIEAQTRSMLPSIRHELELAIRQSVNEAVADELLDMDQEQQPPNRG